jgi:DNA (cytosine-5)-methyltransferase 1
LNSKDYGIPQNRERVWIACKLGGWEFMEFQFPEKKQLKIFVKDILEKEIDKKYLLSEKQVKTIQERIKEQREKGNGFGELPLNPNGTMTTLTQRDYKDGGKRIQFDMSGKGYNSQQDRVYNAEGVMCCLPNAHPDNKVNIFALRSYPRTGSKEQDGDRFQNPEMRGDGITNTLTGVEKDNLVMNCITEAQGRQGSNDCETVSNALYGFEHGTHKHFNDILPNSLMIFRRLTPKECFRLMGFLNDEIELEGLSDTQKYRLVGNGWDINVVSLIFKEIFKIDDLRKNLSGD